MHIPDILSLHNSNAREQRLEDWIVEEAREFKYQSGIRIIRLPRFMWAKFDLLIFYKIQRPIQILEEIDIFCADSAHPGSYGDHFDSYVDTVLDVFSDFIGGDVPERFIDEFDD